MRKPLDRIKSYPSWKMVEKETEQNPNYQLKQQKSTLLNACNCQAELDDFSDSLNL